jgi:hypothetical protein
MRIVKTLISTALLATLPVAAFAWDHEMERGVDLYQAGDADVGVSLVCDPNSVYGTTVSAVLIALGADPDVSAVATFRFPDLITIDAPMTHGRISKAENQDGIWGPLLAGFRAHNAVEITVNDQTHSVALGDPLPFSCI